MAPGGPAVIPVVAGNVRPTGKRLSEMMSQLGFAFPAPHNAHHLVGKRTPDLRSAAGDTSQLYEALRGGRFVYVGDEAVRPPADVGLAFKMHNQAMNMHGVSYGDMLALIRFVAPCAGYPAETSSLEALRRYGTELGLKVADVDPERSGEERAEAVVPVADRWLEDFLASRLGRAWTEDRLSGRERAFVALTAHVTLGELCPSFRRHVELAMGRRERGRGPRRGALNRVRWASPGQSPRWRLWKPFSPLRADGRVLSRSEVMARAPGGSLGSRPSPPPG